MDKGGPINQFVDMGQLEKGEAEYEHVENAKGQIWRQEKRLETDYNFFNKENKELE